MTVLAKKPVCVLVIVPCSFVGAYAATWDADSRVVTCAGIGAGTVGAGLRASIASAYRAIGAPS